MYSILYIYLLNQMPRLLFVSTCNSMWLLFRCGYYSRAAFIKLKGIGEIICKNTCKGLEKSQLNNISKILRCAGSKKSFQLFDQQSFSCKVVSTQHLHSIFSSFLPMTLYIDPTWLQTPWRLFVEALPGLPLPRPRST